MAIDLLIVDDHDIVIKGVHLILGDDPNINIVGEAGNGRQALSMCRALQPTVVLMDMVMPDLNGIQATRRILKEYPDTRILASTGYRSDSSLADIIAAGARGVVYKTSFVDDLQRAVTTVASGEIYCQDPSLAQYFEKRTKVSATRIGGVVLSNREREVLQLVAEGANSVEISDKLAISVRTVERHRSSLKKKLNQQTVAGLTRAALTMGISSLHTSKPPYTRY